MDGQRPTQTSRIDSPLETRLALTVLTASLPSIVTDHTSHSPFPIPPTFPGLLRLFPTLS